MADNIETNRTPLFYKHLAYAAGTKAASTTNLVDKRVYKADQEDLLKQAGNNLTPDKELTNDNQASLPPTPLSESA